MATPTWKMVSDALVDWIEDGNGAHIDMTGQTGRMKQYIRRKVITKWYNRNRLGNMALYSDTKNNVVRWWVKPVDE